MKTTILLLTTISLFAAEVPQNTATSVPVSAEKKAAYWRAVAESEAADSQAKAKHDAVNASVTGMRDECSAMNPPRILGVDQAGEPVCSAKSEPKPANNK